MKKLSYYIRPYIPQMILTVLLVGVSAVMNLYLPNLMSDIVDKGVVKGDIPFIWKIGFQMLWVSLLSIITGVFSHLTSAKVAIGYGRDLREKIFSKVSRFSLEEFDKFSTASLITRTTNDITQIQQAVIMILRMVIRAPIMAIGGIIMAVSINAKMSMILLVSLPALILGIVFIIGKTMPLFKQLQKKIDALNLVLRENLIGIRVIRAFNKEKYEENRFEKANIDLTKTALTVNRINALIFPIMMFVMNFTTLFIIWLGAKQIDANQLLIGDMMAILQYIMQILMSFIMISVIFVFLPRASASAERINQVLLEKTKITNPENPENPGEKSAIKFTDVFFTYPGGSEPVLENLNFTIPEGKTTAIIGNTGSGKTTLLNLILRMYDVSRGSIEFGGKNIKNIDQQTLRSYFGYAPQKPVIFSSSLKENIRFGREELNDGEIKKSAEIAQVLEFAEKMDNGLDTPSAQGGTNLSGGQKQRISIARAIAKHTSVYMFDDTFSALDFKTDYKIRKELKNVMGDSTMVIVAQRVATILHADQIIVLEDGKICGIGTHKELMKTCNTYKEIVFSQLSEEEIASI